MCSYATSLTSSWTYVRTCYMASGPKVESLTGTVNLYTNLPSDGMPGCLVWVV